MARNKSSEVPHYELLYIISNKFTDEETKKIVEKVNTLITSNGGEITFQEFWGKKKLAYPIKNFKHGYYSLVEYNIPGEQIKKIDKELRMSNEVIRHMIVTVPNRTAEEVKEQQRKDKIRRDAEVSAKEEAIKQKTTKDTPTTTTKATTLTEESKTEEASKQKDSKQIKKEEGQKKKANLQDLDAKLDKLLDTDDLL